jgi:hypothetical protein
VESRTRDFIASLYRRGHRAPGHVPWQIPGQRTGEEIVSCQLFVVRFQWVSRLKDTFDAKDTGNFANVRENCFELAAVGNF